MGLGLAIVKNIVENFSGKIWFETELEKGTTFYIEIPVYENTESESIS
jgi:signal transduction histidine kinase